MLNSGTDYASLENKIFATFTPGQKVWFLRPTQEPLPLPSRSLGNKRRRAQRMRKRAQRLAWSPSPPPLPSKRFFNQSPTGRFTTTSACTPACPMCELVFSTKVSSG